MIRALCFVPVARCALFTIDSSGLSETKISDVEDGSFATLTALKTL